tara:strand:+ start:516 stop:698 length:183 start_codon:yes stop_codon:yes gene_type:complete
MNLPGYDNWKLASPYDDAPVPDDHYIECEGCGVKVLEDEAIPINDGTIDHTPRVCKECAK